LQELVLLLVSVIDPATFDHKHEPEQEEE